VTILCDYGSRYQSRLFNAAWLKEKGLPLAPWMTAGADVIIPDVMEAV
jgi:cysteine synthase